MKNKSIIIFLLFYLIPQFAFAAGQKAKESYSENFDQTKKQLQDCKDLYEGVKNRKKAVSSEIEKVYKNCENLANNGNAEAQYYLGSMMAKTAKESQYKATAFSWIYISLENGYKEAEYNLKEIEGELNKSELGWGYFRLMNMYFTELNLNSAHFLNDERSFYYLKKSVYYNNISGYEALGMSYLTGKHGLLAVKKDIISGVKWFYLAKSNFGYYYPIKLSIEENSKLNEQLLSNLKLKMTLKEKSQAKELIKDWINQNSDLVPDKQKALLELEQYFTN